MRITGLLAALALLGACQQREPRVDAAQYDAFWLWAGVEPQPVLKHAKTIYILQGEVKDGADPRLVSLRPGTPKIAHADVWIVYRTETLDWGNDIVPQIIGDLTRWKAAGNRVKGVQIDFDAATRGLAGYAAFLRGLRARLPRDAKLSVTGLLDWSSQGDSADLNALAGVVDEVVLQSYQGRETIPGYEAYLDSLERLDMPYKIGLVQNGNWREPPELARDPDFKGYVVFLLNPNKSGSGPWSRPGNLGEIHISRAEICLFQSC
jgi:hypothetical protein